MLMYVLDFSQQSSEEREEERRLQELEEQHRYYNPDEPEQDIMEWY